TNWLPPDNYQESLRVEIAQRTSLTNIGLWLLAILAAHDFGYLPIDEVVARALPTMKTVEELERYQGHLLNWYDVQSQEALRPRYVSTVDTGNLVGSLWVMLQGCQEILHEPVISPNALLGLQDTLRLLEAAIGDDPAADTLHSAMSELKRLFEPNVEAPGEIIKRLRSALAPAQQLAQSLSARPLNRKPTLRERTDLQAKTSDPRFAISAPSYWAAQIDQQLHLWIHTIDRYLNWMELLSQQPDEFLLPLGEEALEFRHEALSTASSVEALSRGDVPALIRLLELRPQLESSETTPLLDWLNQVSDAFSRARWFAGEMLATTHDLMDRLRKLSDELDMRLLYDENRKLFSIGFNAEEMRLDGSYYDLIATECRIASFISIARGDVPVEHWLTLGRRFGDVNGRLVLLSWTGTMFEYLMPLLFMQAFENSLLDLGCKAAVARQIEYGRQRGVPWGISESAFSGLDTNKIYQYKAFGVPGLGLKRGLEDDLVVAPYATALALLVDTDAAVANLKRLEKLGMRGDYGFYESIDFSRASIGDPEQDGAAVSAHNGQGGKREANPGAIVRAFMVHHQGMSLLAFDNLLHNNIMQRRFHADPYARAATPLLYERIPATPTVLEEAIGENRPRRFALDSQATGAAEDRFLTPDTPTPRTHLLSNGNYSLMLTNAGGGYSLWHDMEITRWRADTTRDNWGSFIYLRDVESGVAWSAAHQPLRRTARFASVTFNADHAEFRRRDAEIETLMEVFVSPEDDVEIRRVILTNHSTRTRQIELTSYAELALAPHNADRAHPAFSKLFVQTEALPDKGALLAWRRLRSSEDPSIWAGHIVATDEPVQNAQYETDRAQFLGRDRTAENPLALEGELSNTAGAVLDPIFSLRRQISLKPGQRAEVAFMTVAAATREAVVTLLDKYAEVASAQRALDMAWTHAQLEMHHLRIQAEDGLRFQQLASYMLYPSVALRAPARRLRENRLSQKGLWAHGISGDLPIMVVTIDNVRDIGTVRQALLAHTYWRIRGFKADLVVLNDQGGSYEQDLSEELKKLIQSHAHYTGMDQPGGVFLRPASNISREDLTLILESARVLLIAARGSLAQQLSISVEQPKQSPRLTLAHRPNEEPSAPLPFMELPYFNGFGGFTVDGREYAIYLGPRQRTPAPWINVMANPQFGAIVSEAGQGYSWYGNSQANKLTPWSNDPVSDPATEAIYIRDEDSGVFWTPTPLPVRELDAYRTRHGQGYTVIEHNSHAIEQELVTFVPVDDKGGLPIGLQRLRLRNRSSRRRKLTITSYQEWVLGTTREEMQPHVVTAWDSENRILLARNSYQQDFGNCSAFLSSSPPPASFTADRTMFMGRNNSPVNPTVMRRKSLVERVGAGLDPCGAVQVAVELEPGQDTEITFMLGQVPDVEQAQQLVNRFRSPAQVEEALRHTREWWDNLLGTLQVEVPDLAVNFLLNRWLPYQTLSCRIWGRSA
ncbi:MAG: hypothetical protein JOZ57_07995, partial [Abitibacteriaceae bacterium]|nr:hypothetical protein [Abditibacteriaceae bacterium]